MVICPLSPLVVKESRGFNVEGENPSSLVVVLSELTVCLDKPRVPVYTVDSSVKVSVVCAETVGVGDRCLELEGEAALPASLV